MLYCDCNVCKWHTTEVFAFRSVYVLCGDCLHMTGNKQPPRCASNLHNICWCFSSLPLCGIHICEVHKRSNTKSYSRHSKLKIQVDLNFLLGCNAQICYSHILLDKHGRNPKIYNICTVNHKRNPIYKSHLQNVSNHTAATWLKKSYRKQAAYLDMVNYR